ncbi:SGNH/GDSL hydrolase family protein [Thalassovita taeanensis]|uniref:GDSL-like Lipase/Acylhydrolase family n=1 Tax=Thalassovita taeanensis TaxID=657014 RepID=A0A1H9KWN3_9RHOB|nr:SGNH/GDSL hydrolase family protein [Thalassovita taeanensis]SER03570.1 GDSL-like Lipase/Acylhydrolase family [Thalassovita taeanensis]
MTGGIENKALEVVFLGGSNTRMANGYVPALIESMQERTDRPVTAKNYAVGISGSVMGLEQFLACGLEDDPEIIFLEYSINDVSLMGHGDLTFWQKCYEGLIRLVRRTYPTAAVYGLFFASQIEHHRAPSRQLLAGMQAWAEHYDGFSLINVHDELEARFSGAVPYFDNMHYGEAAIGPIAEIICDGMQAQNCDTALPAPLTANPFDAPFLVGADSFESMEKRPFSNSIFKFDTAVMKAGQSITLTVPGEIISVSFLSRPKSGILELSDRNGNAFIPTLHKEVLRNGSALFMNAPLLWHDWELPELGSQTIELSVHDTKQEPFHPFFNMIEPQNLPSEVQIRGILIAGKETST